MPELCEKKKNPENKTDRQTKAQRICLKNPQKTKWIHKQKYKEYNKYDTKYKEYIWHSVQWNNRSTDENEISSNYKSSNSCNLK